MRMAIFAAVVAAHIALVWYFLSLWHVAASEETEESSMTLVFLTLPEPDAPREKAPAAPSQLGERSDAASNQPKSPLSAGEASASRVLQSQVPRSQAPPSQVSQSQAPPSQVSQSQASPSQVSQSQASPSQVSQSQASPSQVSQSQVPLLQAPPSQVPPSTALPNPAPNTPTPSTPDWHTEATIVAQSDTQHIVESEDRAARQAGALTAMIKPFNAPRKPGPRPPWDPNPHYRWQPAPGGGFVMALNDHCEVFFLIMVWVGCTVGELPPARGDLFKNMHPPVKYGDWDWRLGDP